MLLDIDHVKPMLGKHATMHDGFAGILFLSEASGKVRFANMASPTDVIGQAAAQSIILIMDVHHRFHLNPQNVIQKWQTND